MATIACAVLLAGGSGIAVAATGGTLGVDFVINSSGVESRAATVPAGDGVLAVIKYSCNSTDCYNVRIRVPLPSGASAGPATFGSEWTETRTGGVLTWTADKISAGATSQITFTLSTSAWSLPDGTVLSQAATMSALGSTTATSAPIELTTRAAGSSHVTVTKTAGGAVDAWTKYVAGVCLDADPDPAFGPLGAQGNSTFTIVLPPGARLVSAAGATVSGSTLTWTMPGIAGYGCTDRPIYVEYPSSERGASKTITASWTGALVGETGTRSLGTANYTHTIATQSDAGNDIAASISAPTAQVGDPLTQSYAVSNGGSGVWETVTLDVPISESFTPGSILATGYRGAGSVYIAIDGGPLVLAASVAAGSVIVIDPYAATLPSGASGLVAPSTVTQVRYVFEDLQPGDGGTALAITSTVRTSTLSGAPIVTGDTFVLPATAEVTTSATAGTTPYTLPLSYQVFTPAPTITVRTGGATIGNGTTTTITGSGDISNDAVVDPIVVLRLPPGLSYEDSYSISYTGGALPEPIVTVLDDVDGAGATLVRWTFPSGTTVARGTSLRVTPTVRLADKAFGDQSFKFFFSSASPTYGCGDPWFLEGPDTRDLDNNGNTSAVLCAWGDKIVPITVVGAQVIQSVKGSWDTDFVAGPATSFTTPGASDILRTELYNSGNIFLRNATVVSTLPRPGDTSILSSVGRSPASSTFPVLLDARPVVPTLSSAVVTYWTTDTGACFPEVGSSPSGCTTPTWTNWDVTAPTSLSSVTALKFDFGSNQLTPFTSWSVDIPVTTPTTGATEPDFAIVNPVPNDPSTDERAVASSAAATTRADISSALTPIESTSVTLSMPGLAGPYSLPAPEDLTSTAPAGVSQGVTVTIPSGGAVHLLDSLGGVVSSNTVVVPGEGTYTLDPATGEITFTPDVDFLGSPTPVRYQVTDSFGGTGSAEYAPTVTAPMPPNPSDLTSTATGPTAQSVTFTIPSGGSVSFLDPATLDPVSDTTLVVAGIGTFALDTATGTVTFTPVDGYTGTPDPVYVGVSDVYGQIGEASYTPTVTRPGAPAAADLTSSKLINTGSHTVSVSVPLRGSLTLIDGGGTPVSSLSVTGVGTYAADQASGAIVFVPARGFSGTAPAVAYRVTDSYGQSDDATYTATVLLPAPPTATDLTTTLPGPEDQTVTVSVPTSGGLALVDGSTSVTALAVPGEGTYLVDSTTGVITFSPEPGFLGAATPVDYIVTDAYGQTATAKYTPTVTLPAAPTPAGTTSSGTGAEVQRVTVSIPAGGSITLVDGGGRQVTQVIVPGEGTYRIDPTTGVVSFAPEPTFTGTATPVTVRVIDSYGQQGDASYGPSVALPASPTASTLTSSAGVGVTQTGRVSVPTATGVVLLDAGGSEVTRVVIPGQGEYTLDVTTGVISFVPEDGFAGEATAVRYRLTDVYGQVAESTYTPTVSLPTPPSAPRLTSSASIGAVQSVVVDIPRGGSVRLLDSTGAAVTELLVSGVGTYVLDPLTGVITFTPVRDWIGAAPPASIRVTDGYGQHVLGTYSPVTTAAATLPARTSSAAPGEAQSIVIPAESGSRVFLLVDGVEVLEWEVPGEGRYDLDPTTGLLTFTPLDGFTGPATAVSYRIIGSDGSVSEGTYTPVVVVVATVEALSTTGMGIPALALGGSVLLIAAGVLLVVLRRRSPSNVG